jgi:Family of unknown function (DUF6516)
VKTPKRRATLLLSEKVPLDCGLLREVVVWSVPTSNKYPDGVKYHLALVDPLSGEVVLLFDNHYPKGHHQHSRDDVENPLIYTNLTDLLTLYYEQEKVEVEKYESDANRS